MEKIKQLVNQYKLSFGFYIILCLVALLISLLQYIAPIKHGNTFYSYEYGFVYPWVKIYKSANLGNLNLFQCLFTGNRLGSEWFPQYLFLNVGIIYIGISIVRHFWPFFKK